MNASSTPETAHPMMSRNELDQLADDLISEKGSKVPSRIRAYLSNPDVKSALEKLVKAKIPLKDIQRGFVDKLGWKVSPTVFRAYMKEEFGYPEPAPSRVGSKTAPAKKAAKKQPRRGK